MKCPECKKKIRSTDAVCASCDHELTPEELKKMKRKRRLGVWIPTGIVLLIVILIAVIILIPSPYLKHVKINKNEIEYTETMSVTLTCENLGAIKTDYPVSLYIDNQTVETVDFSLSGNSEAKKTVTFTPEELPYPGVHTLRVEDVETKFTVLEPAEFVYTYDSEPQPFAVGAEYQIAYTVKNVGPSTGMTNYTITVDGTDIKKGNVKLGPGESRTDVAYISSDSSGDCEICFNDDPVYSTTFYDVSPFKNGYRLMENTIKGYSYIDITNNTGQDMVVYLTKELSPETAVAARYIQNGERHSVNSIMHGEYFIFIQTGDLWMPEVLRFGENEKFYQSSMIDFGNNVRNGSGFYEYIQLELNPGDVSRYFHRVGEIPNIPEQ